MAPAVVQGDHRIPHAKPFMIVHGLLANMHERNDERSQLYGHLDNGNPSATHSEQVTGWSCVRRSTKKSETERLNRKPERRNQKPVDWEKVEARGSEPRMAESEARTADSETMRGNPKPGNG